MSNKGNSEYFVADRSEILDFLVEQRITAGGALDIGCASGRLGADYVKRGIVRECDGIEPNFAAAEQAAEKLRRVWSGTLDAVCDDVPWASYDLVSLADVLEHLPDPWGTLRLLHQRTAPHCRLVLSVPNVRHYKVVMPLLLKGEFRYTDQGIMDRTHLHFFTRSSLEEILAECGWRIVALDSHMKSRYRRWYYPTRWIEPFVAVQYMLVAEKR